MLALIPKLNFCARADFIRPLGRHLALQGLFWMGVLGICATYGPRGEAHTKPSEVTYLKDVAPILHRNCATCHRTGEMAPMPLLTYKDARPWARSIREAVVQRVMPPWLADPQHGEFSNERRLSQKEIDTIVAWVDGGAQEGSATPSRPGASEPRPAPAAPPPPAPPPQATPVRPYG